MSKIDELEKEVDKIFEIVKPLIEGMTGEQIAEFSAGLIGIAAIRQKNEKGYLSAANLCSDISGLASSIGMDMRRAKIKDDAES